MFEDKLEGEYDDFLKRESCSLNINNGVGQKSEITIFHCQIDCFV